MQLVKWRKSTFSGEGNGDCVEVALSDLEAAVRDSKNTAGPQLAFPSTAWQSFVRHTHHQRK